MTLSIVEKLKDGIDESKLSPHWKQVPKDFRDELAKGDVHVLNAETLECSREIIEELGYGSQFPTVSEYILDGTREIIRDEGRSKFMVIGANSAFARALFGSLAHFDLQHGHYESAITAVSIRSDLDEFQDQDLLWVGATCRISYEGTETKEIVDYDVNGSYVEGIESFELSGFKRMVHKFYEMNSVALVLTKDGYFCQKNKGEIDLNHPDIQHDLDLVREHFVRNEGDIERLTRTPKTIFGMLAIAIGHAKDTNEKFSTLRREYVFSLPVIIPADNLPVSVNGKFGAIGQYTKRSLETFLTDAGLGDIANFVTDNLRVPNTMVDRITSKFGPERVRDVYGIFGGVDARIVPTEGKPHFGALMMDRHDYDKPGHLVFASDRKTNWMKHFGDVDILDGEDPNDPDYLKRKKSALFSPDATTWAELKSRTINTTHVVLAYFGKYLGMEKGFVHEVIAVPGVESFLQNLIKREIVPRLSSAPKRLQKPGEMDKYIADVMHRMKNSANPDKLDRLDTEGSTKIPDRVLSIIEDFLESGAELNNPAGRNKIRMLVFVCAVWLTLAVQKVDQNGDPVKIEDSLINPDPQKSSEPSIFSGIQDPLKDFDTILGIKSIFGDLGDNRIFRSSLKSGLRWLKRYNMSDILRIGNFDISDSQTHDYPVPEGEG